jgi:hypothetical protein
MSRILTLAILGLFALTAAAQPESLRGRLVAAEGKPPVIETAAHKLVTVAGDSESLEVLGDARLAGADIELLGRFDAPEHFTVGPFYTSKSILVHKDGKIYTVSYWCPVCSIRTYTPGKCRCCREETHLDLEELKP